MFSSRPRFLLVVTGLATVVQEVHEEREVLQEERTFGFHQITLNQAKIILLFHQGFLLL